MAKVSTGPLISDIRNKIGDVVFFRNRAGLANRAYAIPTQPDTDRQLDCQAAMTAAMLRWQTTLTDTQRQGWETFAQRFPNRTSINGVRPLSGTGAYIARNLFSIMYAAAYIDQAPLDQDVTQPRDLALDTNNATGYAVDKFDRVDSNDLGTDWTVAPANSFQIFSHQVGPNNGGALGYAANNTRAFTDDQVSRATLSLGPNATVNLGLTVRCTPAGPTTYGIWIQTTKIILWKIVAGAFTTLLTGTTPPTLGRTYELRVQGTTLTVYENGALFLGPHTDAAIAAGAPGLVQLGATPLQLLDNWIGKDLAAADPLTISLTTPALSGEVLVVKATLPLSAGILNFNGWLKVIGYYPAPVAYPLDIFWKWKNTYDLILIPPPAPPAPPETPAGTLVATKRIGVTAYFVRLANGAASQALSSHSLTT